MPQQFDTTLFPRFLRGRSLPPVSYTHLLTPAAGAAGFGQMEREMKFNKQLSNGGLFLPSAALKISGFEDSGQVEIHALKNTAVIMKPVSYTHLDVYKRQAVITAVTMHFFIVHHPPF